MKKIFKVDKLINNNLFHGFFNREYGNISFFYGDKENVNKNRQKLCKSIGIKQAKLWEMEQVHGSSVQVIKNKKQTHFLKKTDGIITGIKNEYLFLKSADCFPLILYSPEKQVLALLHVGWKGCMQHIIEKAILQMLNEFQIKASTIQAGIGPGIRKCCYKFADVFQKNLPEWDEYVSKTKDKYAVDLPGFIINSLRKSNIVDIYDINICTGCSQQFFSHYKSKKCNSKKFDEKKGLFATVTCLR